MSKLNYIDSLRGIAVLGVLAVHCGQVGKNIDSPILKGIIDAGSAGVQLFFVLSAFTLTLSYQNRSNERNLTRSFFIRRFFRIAPLYYLGIIFYLWQNGLGYNVFLGDTDRITPLNIVANVLFLHGLNPYWINSVVPGGWSIAVEMTFYLMFPLLMKKIKSLNDSLNFILFSLLLLSLLSYVLSRFPIINDTWLWGQYLFFFLPSQLPVFGLGIFLFYLIKEDFVLGNLQTSSVLGLFLYIFLFVSVHKFLRLDTHFAYGASFILLICGLHKQQYKLLVNQVTVYLGKVSYSMYISHFAIIHLITEYNIIDIPELGDGPLYSVINYAIRFIVLLVLTIMVSTILHQCIEIPFQKLGRMLIQQTENKHREIAVVPN